MTCELSYIWKNRTEWNFRLSKAKECEAEQIGVGGGGKRQRMSCPLNPANAGHAEEHQRRKGPDVKGGLGKNCWTAWKSFLADKPRGPSV